MDKKRHHYVPVTYLRFFCDERGKIHIYRADDPDNVLHQRPDNTGFRRYYYSQPTPDGGRDHNALEDVFAVFEGYWPELVAKIQERRELDGEDLLRLNQFMTLQRIRVPAARDASEKILADQVLHMARRMDATGELPPKPPGFEYLLDHLEIPIDPHQSIHAMVHVAQSVGEMLSGLKLAALHNQTNIQFLSSDNPVIWFDPTLPENKVLPYVYKPGGPVVLFFPISPDVILYGEGPFKKRGGLRKFQHRGLNDRQLVKTINRHIARFSYEIIFSAGPGHERLTRKHSNVSPVLRTWVTPGPDGGNFVFHQFVFGPREAKAKWTGS